MLRMMEGDNLVVLLVLVGGGKDEQCTGGES